MITRDVSVLILEDHGRILLQKRSKTDKRFPDSWGLFGGGVEKGEKPEEALKREIEEELGLDVVSPKFIAKSRYVFEKKGETGNVWIFKMKYRGEKILLREGDKMEWFDPDELSILKIHPIYLKIISDTIGHKSPSMIS